VKSAKRKFDPQAFLAKVGTGKTILKYRKGRIIYAQGEEADRIFYIQSGKVKVTVVSEQGKEAVVGILDAAQFFGEGCLNGQAVRVGTAMAMEEKRYHHDNAKGDAGGAAQGAQIFGTLRHLPGDPQQSH
jgi:CRP-like cAMP-binding protein